MDRSIRERTAIHIDLDALKANYLTACSLTQAKVICVLKSNAYGHGLRMTALALHEAGCDFFAVSCAREAMEVLRAVPAQVLIMGPCEVARQEKLLGERVIFTVTCEEDLWELEESCTRTGKDCQVHIKIDTGFHRLGFDAGREAAMRIARTLAQCTRVRATGLYSHLGLVNRELDVSQHDRFLRMREELAACGLTGLSAHLCDSIGLVRYPHWHMDMVRVGAFLYGVRPSRSEQMPFECLEALCFQSTVTQVRDVRAGEVIGYDEDRVDHDAKIATVCAGYGDGYPRRLSCGRGQVLICGRRCPVVGLVCMDQMMVDVTGVPGVCRGSEVTLLGGGIGYSEYADWAGTNRNECLSILSSRPVRIYEENGKIRAIVDDLIRE